MAQPGFQSRGGGTPLNPDFLLIESLGSFQEPQEPYFPDWSEAVIAAIRGDINYYPDTDDENDENSEEMEENNNGEQEVDFAELEALDKRNRDIQNEREGAHIAQKAQAEKMLETSKKRLVLLIHLFSLYNTFIQICTSRSWKNGSPSY